MIAGPATSSRKVPIPTRRCSTSIVSAKARRTRPSQTAAPAACSSRSPTSNPGSTEGCTRRAASTSHNAVLGSPRSTGASWPRRLRSPCSSAYARSGSAPIQPRVARAAPATTSEIQLGAQRLDDVRHRVSRQTHHGECGERLGPKQAAGCWSPARRRHWTLRAAGRPARPAGPSRRNAGLLQVFPCRSLELR